jgi:hypothetical protein
VEVPNEGIVDDALSPPPNKEEDGPDGAMLAVAEVLVVYYLLFHHHKPDTTTTTIEDTNENDEDELLHNVSHLKMDDNSILTNGSSSFTSKRRPPPPVHPKSKLFAATPIEVMINDTCSSSDIDHPHRTIKECDTIPTSNHTTQHCNDAAIPSSSSPRHPWYRSTSEGLLMEGRGLNQSSFFTSYGIESNCSVTKLSMSSSMNNNNSSTNIGSERRQL